MLFLQKPRYYDAPDGQKPFDKVVAMSKKGFIAGLVAGMGDCIWLTDTKNAQETVNCLAYWVVPIVGMSATWASVTYMSTKIRGKDDWVNYSIGAAACAPIFHAWKKSVAYTLWGTTILMFAAAIAKDKQIKGWEAFPEPQHNYGIYKYDFTIMKDCDKNFRTPYKYQA